MKVNGGYKMDQSCQPEKLFSRREASEFLRVTEGTLAVWASTKRYPLKFVKIGRLVKYRYADLIQFLEERTQLKDEEK